MYLVVSVENLKLYEPPLIRDTEEVGHFPRVDKFTPKYLDKLHEDIILDRRTRTSRQGDMNYVHIGFKGLHPSKAHWIEKEKVREKFPHFPID